MRRQNIDIICMQETHRNERLHEITNEGYLLILSGETESSETAGVGVFSGAPTPFLRSEL